MTSPTSRPTSRGATAGRGSSAPRGGRRSGGWPRGDAVLARIPLRTLHITGGQAEAARLAEWRGLSRLHGLRLRHADPTEAAWEVTRSPHLGGLRSLLVGRPSWSGTDIAHLASASFAGSLRTLHFDGCNSFVAAAKSLARADLPSLRRIGWWEYDLNDSCLLALSRWPRLASIESFELGISRLGGRGLLALADSPHPLRPRSLLVGAADLARPPCRGPFLSRVEDLCLGPNLGPGDVAALVDAPGHGLLWRLHIRSRDVGDQGAAALAGWPRLRRLVDLDLAECGLGDEGLIALARSSTLGPVRKLGLMCNQFTPRGIGELASSRLMRTVTDLSLYYCGLDTACMELLASAEMPHLRYLSLSDSKADATPLLRASWLDQLRILSIYRKQGPRPVMRALRGRLGDRLKM